MNKKHPNRKKPASSKFSNGINAEKAKIKYKKSARKMVAKFIAAQDIAQKRGTSNAFNLPDWIDHDTLWDVYRNNPLAFTIEN